jgi:GNAT superfamily N-acetyltransferase
MEIKEYNKERDEQKLMEIIRGEGQEWACYSGEKAAGKYKLALQNSISYVAYEGNTLCAFSRSIEDCGYYIYVCDLLVKPEFRGKNIGRQLMEILYHRFPDQTVYVMSDVDEYYHKLGYKREGSLFEVSKS